MRKTIRVNSRVLVYSPTDHGYVDPEDHYGMDGFGGSRTVWRFPRKKRVTRQPNNRPVLLRKQT